MSLNRFAVGYAGGQQSCSWKLWTQGDEAYLLQRGITAQHQKFSFHKSGNCRWAMIQPGISGADRAILEWQRDMLPAPGSGQGCRLLSLAFPTNHLSAPQKGERKPIRWIDPAPPGKAVRVELFVVQEDRPTIERLLGISEERYLLCCQTLRSGMQLCAAVSLFECDPVDLNMPRTDAPGAVFGDIAFPDQDEQGTGRPIRMLLMPGKDLPPMVWELGGYKVDNGLTPRSAPPRPN